MTRMATRSLTLMTSALEGIIIPTFRRSPTMALWRKCNSSMSLARSTAQKVISTAPASTRQRFCRTSTSCTTSRLCGESTLAMPTGKLRGSCATSLRSEGYLHGTRVNQTALLQDINVLYNLTLVRRIHLGYANREAARLLRNITLIGRDNRSALPPIKFEYATPPSGWAQNSSFALPQGVYLGEQKDLGVRFLDVNADGFDDLLRMTDTSTLESWLNTKSGWERQENISGFLQGGFVERYGQDRGVRFFDIDGDATTDVIKLSRDGNVTTLIKANGRDRWTEKQVSFPENVSFVIGKAEPACVPASCPSGTTQPGDACVSGLCSRTCEYQYCSSSGTLVLDSSSNSQPEWNDNDHDEEDWGETFTPSSNKCYKFEFTGSEQTDSDDSQCYDLYTDNDNSRNLYSRDCNGRDIDAYAGVGFVGSRSSSTWLRTVDGGADRSEEH